MNKLVKEGLKETGAEVGKAVGKTVLKAIGDKMATAKRPFWRKLVGFFRGTNK